MADEEQTVTSPQEKRPVDERLTFGCLVLTGYKVEVQVKSGFVYEGIFNAAMFEHSHDPEDHCIIVKYARVIKDPTVKVNKDALAERPMKSKLFKASDVVQVVAKDVRMNPEDLSSMHEEFETDAAISRGRGGEFGRELQRWMPEDGDAHDPGPLLSLDTDSRGHGVWDQFAVNERQFGVSTTYDEHLYTTVVKKDVCGISEAQAARLAREIERGNLDGATGLAAYHILEERGMEIDDSTMNEEDRYGAVVRDAPRDAKPSGPYGLPTNSSSRNSTTSGGPSAPGSQSGAAPAGASAAGAGSSASGAAPPPPPARAWGGMGAGVAAVAGKLPTPGPAGASAAPVPAPTRGMGSRPASSSGLAAKDVAPGGAASVAAAAAPAGLPGGKPLAGVPVALPIPGVPAMGQAAQPIVVPGLAAAGAVPAVVGMGAAPLAQVVPQVPAAISIAAAAGGVPVPVPLPVPVPAAAPSAADDRWRRDSNKARPEVPIGGRKDVGLGDNRHPRLHAGFTPGSRSNLSTSPQLTALNLDLLGPNPQQPVTAEYARWKASRKQQEEQQMAQRQYRELLQLASQGGSTSGSLGKSLGATSQGAVHTGGPAVPAHTTTGFSAPANPPTSASGPAAAPAAAAVANAAPVVTEGKPAAVGLGTAGQASKPESAADAIPAAAASQAGAAAPAAPSSTAGAAPATAGVKPGAEAAATTAAAPAPAVKKSSLNPNAKEFTLNFKAAEFVPGKAFGATSTAASSTASSTPAAHGSGATTAPSSAAPSSIATSTASAVPAFSSPAMSQLGGAPKPHHLPATHQHPAAAHMAAHAGPGYVQHSTLAHMHHGHLPHMGLHAGLQHAPQQPGHGHAQVHMAGGDLGLHGHAGQPHGQPHGGPHALAQVAGHPHPPTHLSPGMPSPANELLVNHGHAAPQGAQVMRVGPGGIQHHTSGTMVLPSGAHPHPGAGGEGGVSPVPGGAAHAVPVGLAPQGMTAQGVAANMQGMQVMQAAPGAPMHLVQIPAGATPYGPAGVQVAGGPNPNSQPMQLPQGAMLTQHAMLQPGQQIAMYNPAAVVQQQGMPGRPAMQAVQAGHGHGQHTMVMQQVPVQPNMQGAGQMFPPANGMAYVTSVGGPQGFMPLPMHATTAPQFAMQGVPTMPMAGGPMLSQNHAAAGGVGGNVHHVGSVGSQGEHPGGPHGGMRPHSGMKGPMMGGRGGRGGGRGSSHGSMEGMHMGGTNMVLQVAHDGPKPQHPPPPPPGGMDNSHRGSVGSNH